MFARRKVKRRFQVDTPKSSPLGSFDSPLLSALPIRVKVKSRHRKRRLQLGSSDVGLWRGLPFQVVVVRGLQRRALLTLAQRRQLSRQVWIAGGLVVLFAVVASSLWFIPATHAALFPRTARATSAGAARGQQGAIQYAPDQIDAPPFAALQVYASKSASPAPSVQANAAFLFDPERGVVLYQKNADAQYPAASLTKVMTLMVAMGSLQLDQLITIGPDAAALVNSNNSYMGVSAGERITLRDLLYGLMVAGGNDAALAIADAVGGDQATFVQMMNARAQRLGLLHTHFVSADGVNDQNITSASDMARLSALVITNPDVTQITSVFYRVIPKTVTHKTFTLYGSNDLLPGGSSPYAGANGVKTGYTAGARYCIAFSARVNGHLLVGVLLGEPSNQARLADARALLNWGFAQE